MRLKYKLETNSSASYFQNMIQCNLQFIILLTTSSIYLIDYQDRISFDQFYLALFSVLSKCLLDYKK